MTSAASHARRPNRAADGTSRRRCAAQPAQARRHLAVRLLALGWSPIRVAAGPVAGRRGHSQGKAQALSGPQNGRRELTFGEIRQLAVIHPAHTFYQFHLAMRVTGSDLRAKLQSPGLQDREPVKTRDDAQSAAADLAEYPEQTRDRDFILGRDHLQYRRRLFVPEPTQADDQRPRRIIDEHVVANRI